MKSKKILALLLVFAIAFGMIASAGSVQAKAATKKGMDTSTLTKLKVDKKYTAKYNVGDTNKKIKATYYITNLSVKDSKKAGYKQLKFTFVSKYSKVKFTSDEIHNYCNGEEFVSIYRYFTLVDTKTGKCLECDNDYDVVCTSNGWNKTQHDVQYDYDGCWIQYDKTVKATVTVTYPDTYKNLGILAGLCELKQSEMDEAFWNGECSFEETSMFAQADKYDILFKAVK